METGENLKGKEDYKEAIAAFQKAKNLKPEESLPTEKIEEINEILATQKDVAQKEAEYNKLMTEGNGLRDEKDWLNAKGKYTSALSFKENDPTAQSEIDKIDKILADEKQANEKDQAFIDLVSKGDGYFLSKDYKNAISTYKSALEIKNDDLVIVKIKNCEEKWLN